MSELKRMEFWFNYSTRRAECEDPTIFVKKTTVTRELEFCFLLSWGEKKIAFRARQDKTTFVPDRRTAWILYAFGSIHQYYPQYEFESKQELTEAVALAKAATSKIPYGLNVDRSEIISAQIYSGIVDALDELPQ